MAAPRDVIPDQNVAIQAVVSPAIDMLGFRNPIVVIGGAREDSRRRADGQCR